MRVFEAEHYFTDTPNERQTVLVGVMSADEMDAYQQTRDASDASGDESTLNQWFKQAAGEPYVEDDFQHYFLDDEWEARHDGRLEQDDEVWECAV